MKRKFATGWLWVLLLGWMCAAGWAAEETAIINQPKVNIRGQPTSYSEVVTQMQKGEQVTILEEVTVEKPKADDPAKWARIKLPPNTPVWVFAPYLDFEGKAVKVSRLNLRAGPGENFSVLGRVDRGTPFKEIRRVEDWVEIEAPPSAYAFVAMDLLAKPGQPAGVPPTLVASVPATPAATAQSEPVKPAEPAAAPAQPPPIAEVEKIETEPATPPPVKDVPPAIPAAAQATPPAVTETPPAIATAAPVLPPAVETPPAEAAAPEPAAVPPSTKRIVHREGIVRSSTSPQAPTYYELINMETKKTVNFLHGEKNAIKLKEYRGLKVHVAGEEGIDKRWPKIPVLEVEKIEVIP